MSSLKDVDEADEKSVVGMVPPPALSYLSRAQLLPQPFFSIHSSFSANVHACLSPSSQVELDKITFAAAQETEVRSSFLPASGITS